MTDRVIRVGELAGWLNARLDNCLRIAATKHGEDRDGWLEDAAYFEAAIKVVDWASDQPDFPRLSLFEGERR